MGDAEQLLDLAGAETTGPLLAECHYYQDHGGPVHPAAHEQTRRRQTPPTAPLATTAEAQADAVLVGQLRWTSTGLAHVVGVVQRPATMRTTLLLLGSGKILVDEVKETIKSDCSKKID